VFFNQQSKKWEAFLDFPFEWLFVGESDTEKGCAQLWDQQALLYWDNPCLNYNPWKYNKLNVDRRTGMHR